MIRVQIIGDAPALHREILVSGESGEASWRAPEEVPVAFVYNRRNYAVMLATPDDIVDYAVGFSLTEGVAGAPSDIESIDIHFTDRGVDLRITLVDAALERFDVRQRRRALSGDTSCGLCGLENADALFQPLAKVAPSPVALDFTVVNRALEAMPARQALNAATRSVHGAAFASTKGEILLLREDVGRHNALDKLIGALAQSDADASAGFVVMSSRCSYELVEKAARAGVRALVSVSGPTGMAIDRAREANLALYARGPNGAVAIT